MKKWVAVLAIGVAALALWLVFSKSGTLPPIASQGNTAAEDSAVARALANQNANTVAIIQSNFARVQLTPGNPGIAGAALYPLPAGHPGPPAPLQFTNFPPSIVLESMSRAVRQYGQMFGGNPVGTNPEITSQLSGNNPKHINFLNAEAGMRVNENGELVDAWGTPYFFHQLSGTDMEIHSAGPDRIMWTADDLVSR
jgi:hypothetical protein